MANKNIFINYKFDFGFGGVKDFKVELDSKTLNLIRTPKDNYPDWTKLDFHKCPNCPMDNISSPYCPVATGLSEVIDFFAALISFAEADLTIETAERTYVKRIPLQKGISSLFGIYMVTTGCPIMGKLRPMVRHHLPFATVSETKYRALSMYLLSQLFIYRKGGKPDWDLKKLGKIYEDIRIVNKSFAARLKAASVQDANANALIILDMFADSVVFSVDENALSEIEHLFD